MHRDDDGAVPSDVTGSRSALPIVDGHVHFWDQSALDYSWLAGYDAISGPYLPDQVPEAVEGCRVEHLVFVQADCAPHQAEAEVAWVTGLRSTDPRISAIVAFASLERRGVEPVLETYAANPLIKGVRRIIQGEDPGFTTLLVEGVRTLSALDLSFDVCVTWQQLGEVVDLVDAAPEVRFVLDHLGKPPISAGELQPWADNITELARRPNVVAKLSGMVTEADLDAWQPDDLRPYVEHAVATFGPKRLMFGSDWPVMTLASQYADWFTTLRSLAGFSDAEEAAVFRTNALEFYRMTG